MQRREEIEFMSGMNFERKKGVRFEFGGRRDMTGRQMNIWLEDLMMFGAVDPIVGIDGDRGRYAGAVWRREGLILTRRSIYRPQAQYSQNKDARTLASIPRFRNAGAVPTRDSLPARIQARTDEICMNAASILGSAAR